MEKRLIILAVGQPLRGDDGAGPAALQAWQAAYPLTAGNPALTALTLSTPGLDLLETLEGFPSALIIDAVQANLPAGSCLSIQQDQLESFAAGNASAHGWGIAETLALGRKMELSELPRNICLLGICGSNFNLGNPLSPQVAAALPRVAEEIERQVQDLLAIA